jgi:hypothetical protein
MILVSANVHKNPIASPNLAGRSLFAADMTHETSIAASRSLVAEASSFSWAKYPFFYANLEERKCCADEGLIEEKGATF